MVKSPFQMRKIKENVIGEIPEGICAIMPHIAQVWFLLVNLHTRAVTSCIESHWVPPTIPPPHVDVRTNCNPTIAGTLRFDPLQIKPQFKKKSLYHKSVMAIHQDRPFSFKEPCFFLHVFGSLRLNSIYTSNMNFA